MVEKKNLEKINNELFEVSGVDYNHEKKKIYIDFLGNDGRLWASSIICYDVRFAIWLEKKLKEKIFIDGFYNHNNGRIIPSLMSHETHVGRRALWRFL